MLCALGLGGRTCLGIMRELGGNNFGLNGSGLPISLLRQESP